MKKAQMSIPVAKPNPPRLSKHARELAEIEASGIFSNFGPTNRRFEEELISTMFGSGYCLTVCNATLGLMVAIREVIGENRPAEKRYALMPSFTFAATAHAAMWNNLTPLLYDIDPETWLPSATAEQDLLAQYAGQVAVIVPYATFGNNLDLPRYEKLSELYDVPVVVDAAASLGSLDMEGKAFGTDFKWPVVFSMHATKTFSTGEGGVIYCADEQRVKKMKSMCSFGFESPRIASTAGLNAKLTEVAALTALLQLKKFRDVIEHRQTLSWLYRRRLPGWTLQKRQGERQSYAFQSVLLPEEMAPRRAEILELLREQGVGASTYFSPHLAEQPYFARHSICSSLTVTENICSRILTLPMFDAMTESEVGYVATSLHVVIEELMTIKEISRPVPHTPAKEPIAAMVPPYRKGDLSPDIPSLGLSSLNRA